MVKIAITLLLLFFSPSAHAAGKFISPLDVCWSCIFPIHLEGFNITPSHKDFIPYKKKLFCRCQGGLIGLPVSFWEPTRLVDVTRTPYKLLGLGGISLGKSGSKRGGVQAVIPGVQSSSFYHIHLYTFPLLHLLDLGLDLFCEERSILDVVYMSEFDPFWMGDNWSSVINPETILFSNPLAQAACIIDCASASFQKPIERLFWCAGCHQNTVYPLIGNVGSHIGGIQASSLLVHRVLAKMHSLKALSVFQNDEYCRSSRPYRIKKTAYKTQLTYPVSQAKGPCNALGRSDVFWGSGRSFPFKGEDFVYLVWTKKHCCLDPVKATTKSIIRGK